MLGKRAVERLAALRREFEEDTEAAAWPRAAERELTLLADVCGALGASDGQLVEVLGATAAAFVAAEAVAGA